MLSLPAVRRTTLHFTHPFLGHILEEVHADTEYYCEACKTYGGGTRFKCNSCDYTMHDWCTTCPSNLASFMHLPHPLNLAVTQSNRTCHICKEDIDGLFYYCQYCENFDVHPLCTCLPQNICHVLHQVHPLTLQNSRSVGYCAVCGGECCSWRYKCTTCNFDLHIECASVPCVLGPFNSPLQNDERRIPPYADYGYSSCGNSYTTHGYNDNSYGYNQYNYGQNEPPDYGNYGIVPCNYFMPQSEIYNYGTIMQNGHQESGGATNKWGVRCKKMYVIVGQLAMGVLSNLLFGLIVAI